MDPDLERSLEEAVEASPENHGVRLHLARLLLEAGRAEDALRHAQAVIAMRPLDGAALQCAAESARTLGRSELAETYAEAQRAIGKAAETKGVSVVPEQAEGASAPVVELSSVRGGREPANGDVERPEVRLADVGGMEDVKRRLELSFLGPMRNAKVRAAYGKSLRGGMLLYGPPGCGKTFIARATAGELDSRFLAVGLSDVLDMWLGQSERNLHEIFETARRSAPCVLFLDEIDALGQKRSHLRHHAGRNVVNQLLAELDGIQSTNEGVFLLGATNHPWDVDTALRRPGRFDRMLLVAPPDRAAREAILRYHARGRPVAEDVDLAWVADRTDGFSGADLAHVCESAMELAMERSLTGGEIQPATHADFQSAMKQISPSTRPWFDTARNYAMFANEGGTYDDLLEYMRTHRLA